MELKVAKILENQKYNIIKLKTKDVQNRQISKKARGKKMKAMIHSIRIDKGNITTEEGDINSKQWNILCSFKHVKLLKFLVTFLKQNINDQNETQEDVENLNRPITMDEVTTKWSGLSSPIISHVGTVDHWFRATRRAFHCSGIPPQNL